MAQSAIARHAWGMSEFPSRPGFITDQQRDRAVELLQNAYASGQLSEPELDRRLDQALGAIDKVSLNRALLGVARVAPAVLTPRAKGEPSPAESVGAGLVHLSGLATSFVGPAIVKTISPPGSRTWLEAARAMSLQITAAAFGVAALMLSILLDAGWLFALAWAAWLGATIWASVRAFHGKSGTGLAEPFLLAKPQQPVTGQLGPRRYTGA